MSVRRWVVPTVAALVTLGLTACEPLDTTTPGGRSTSSKGKPKPTAQSGATVKITTSNRTCWAGRIGTTTKQGCGSATFQVRSSKGAYTVNLRKTKGADGISVVLVVNGKKVDQGSSSSVVAVSYVSG
ncbi:hypothetical protein AB0L64_27500 [Kribbella sp. NPDC051936]|uniref:hypothetical protein n=1 Tax=Kribbella sp. NPDC051936 TaxID=3154946 RepID=UPI003422E4F5